MTARSFDEMSLRNLHTHKECPWLCGAIKVARVAELTFVEVALETVEDVLHTGIELQVDVVVQDECIAGLEVKVKEIGCRLQTVVLNVTGIVRDNHRAGVCSREREVEPFHG